PHFGSASPLRNRSANATFTGPRGPRDDSCATRASSHVETGSKTHETRMARTGMRSTSRPPGRRGGTATRSVVVVVVVFVRVVVDVHVVHIGQLLSFRRDRFPWLAGYVAIRVEEIEILRAVELRLDLRDLDR